MGKSFVLKCDFGPAGDQPQAIRRLTTGLHDGLAYQTLLGVTGSGKTFTLANVIEHVQRRALILPQQILTVPAGPPRRPQPPGRRS